MATRTRRSVFYHIPKTGGTWVKVAMKEAGLQTHATRNITAAHPFNLKRAHATPDIVRPKDVAGKFSFCFVRRPVAWYRSYWSFRSRKGARRDEKFPADGVWSDDFDQFVNNCLDLYPSGFVSTLYQFYTGLNGERVDFIGRQEHLADDLVRSLGMAGEEFDEGALRATPKQNRSLREWKDQCKLSVDTLLRVNDAERWINQFYA